MSRQTIRPARKTPQELAAAKAAARERYAAIAELLKAEAGVRRHYKHKVIGGLAWTGEGKILAPEGITRRQLYVLAHECGHIVLHSSPHGQAKPGHVKEHEAETYAHRAFARYGLEVPEKSAKWARAYVGQWIMKDKAAGVEICTQAALFALGQRSPHDPLPAIEGQPPNDFSKSLVKFVAKGQRVADAQEKAELTTISANLVTVTDSLPNSCATCWFYEGNKTLTDWTWGQCKAYARRTLDVRDDAGYCNRGTSWRPHPDLIRKYSYEKRRGFLARLGDAIIERLSGRNRRD